MKVNVRKWLNSIVFKLCTEFPNRNLFWVHFSVYYMLPESTKVESAAKEAFSTSLGGGEASYCSKVTAAAESGTALTIIWKGFYLSLQA